MYLVQLSQGYRATARRQFTFYLSFQGAPGSHAHGCGVHAWCLVHHEDELHEFQSQELGGAEHVKGCAEKPFCVYDLTKLIFSILKITGGQIISAWNVVSKMTKFLKACPRKPLKAVELEIKEGMILMQDKVQMNSLFRCNKTFIYKLYSLRCDREI